MSLTKIVLNKQSDLVLNNAVITSPTGIVKSDIPELVQDLADLVSADAALSASLAAETAARIADVDAEETRALAAEAALSASLVAEVAARIADVNAEETRALAAEAGLSASIADIISNTDVTNIDSFVEVINEINTVNAANFDAVYAKKNTSTQAPNGTATAFPFVNAVKMDSEQVYLNGLLLEAGDYTVNTANGMATGVTFGVAPVATDKVVFYGVYGSLTTITF